jgi:hypothetical protein
MACQQRPYQQNPWAIGPKGMRLRTVGPALIKVTPSPPRYVVEIIRVDNNESVRTAVFSSMDRAMLFAYRLVVKLEAKL